MEDSPMYAADIRALIMRADSADWTAEALAVENRVLRGAIEALTARAERAEARVKEMTAELADQERAKLLLIQETHRWSAAVKTLEAERVAAPAGDTEDARKGEAGRVDCPSCDNSLAWDERWAGDDVCKYCGYPGEAGTPPAEEPNA